MTSILLITMVVFINAEMNQTSHLGEKSASYTALIKNQPEKIRITITGNYYSKR